MDKNVKSYLKRKGTLPVTSPSEQGLVMGDFFFVLNIKNGVFSSKKLGAQRADSKTFSRAKFTPLQDT